jgi:iduronate 2-sulfatase
LIGPRARPLQQAKRLPYNMGACVAAVLVSLCLGASVYAKQNILLIVADDLNCAIGPYGDEVAVTPNLDRLAERGLVFENAYCQQAVCNPSRSSFLTGLRPDTVGVDDLRKSFRETAPNGALLVTLPQQFKNQGYFCQNIGKMFHNMGETQDRRSWSIDEVLFKGTHAMDTVFSNIPLRAGDEKPPYKAPLIEALDVADTAYRDGQIANLAAAMLLDHAEVETEQPFFLAVGFWRPHLPFVAPKKYWDVYDAKAIPLPENPQAPADVPDIAMHESREIRGYGGTPKDREFTDEETRRYRHGYYAAISFLDAQVGEVLDALEESGQAEETVVVFTSDHGFHIGEHSLWGKTSNFELDARVPLIIASPLRRHAASVGKRTTALAELVDLYPTLFEVAGLQREELPENLEGKSLVPVLRDPSATVKDAAFTQHQQPFYGSRENWQAWGYSVRTDRWRFTEWRKIDGGEVMARELYDHENDSLETKNVAGDEANAAVVEKLSKRLTQQFPM